jgi:diacylglycerol kinase family enzyme
MNANSGLNILFIINPGSGAKKKIQWEPVIRDYFKQLSFQIEFMVLTGKDDEEFVKNRIKELNPEKVVAVGGDGTISMVASQLRGTSIPLGILRGGSANGMATELEIPGDTSAALDIIVKGKTQQCDMIQFGKDEFCIHLSDLGLNARLIKYFDKSAIRGMWGYVRYLAKILLEGKPVKAHIVADDLEKDIPAFMIVFANASKYGTGAVINPDGSISDGKFELVIVRQISFVEFAKLFLKKTTFNPKKVEVIQTTQAVVTLKKKTHFQVDGEYLGKTNKITASIVPGALLVMAPDPAKKKANNKNKNPA